MTEVLPQIQVTDSQARKANPVIAPTGSAAANGIRDGRPKSGNPAEGSSIALRVATNIFGHEMR